MKFLAKLYNYVRCVPRTIFFNFYYLPFSQAIRFPIIVSHRTRFQSLKGKITVPKDAKTAKIKLGFGIVQCADNRFSRFFWNLQKSGTIEFGNNIKIGTGCKLHVSGKLTIGNRVNFTGECSLTCQKEITFGDRCLISWRTIIMDTDFHAIENEAGERINPDSPIHIGDKVWICANTTVLKGVSIGSNSIVSASANVVSSFASNSIIGGNPAKQISSMEGKSFVH